MQIKLLEEYKPLFQPPDTRYFILTGGRGSAKSWHVALFLLTLTNEPGHVILYARYTMISAHISIIPEFLEKIELLGVYNDFEVTKNEIVNNKTGSRILFRGIKTSSGNQTAALKSIQGVTTFVLDEGEEMVNEDDFDTIDLSIRAKDKENRVILIMNPSHREHFIYKRWFKEKRTDTTYIHTTYKHNYKNLSQSFIEQAERTYRVNEARYNHLFMGDWIDSAEGLLWTRGMIERCRIEKSPTFERIVVAIDPAGTKTMTSDETGIVIVGKANENYYVLEDLSGKYSPNEWATIATTAVKRWGADCIVAEKNMGHDMVEAVIRQYDKATRVKLVNATRGKIIRAEPVFSLYEQGKAWHVGNHPLLELQMTAFNPNENKDSPDRVDALVWGLTELSGGVTWEFAVF